VQVFVIALAVAAFWFARVFAVACSVVVFSAFSAAMFLLALCYSMPVFAAVVTLCSLQFGSILLCVVQTVVDVDALCNATTLQLTRAQPCDWPLLLCIFIAFSLSSGLGIYFGPIDPSPAVTSFHFFFDND
jgi:hypothetical protein